MREVNKGCNHSLATQDIEGRALGCDMRQCGDVYEVCAARAEISLSFPSRRRPVSLVVLEAQDGGTYTGEASSGSSEDHTHAAAATRAEMKRATCADLQVIRKTAPWR